MINVFRMTQREVAGEGIGCISRHVRRARRELEKAKTIALLVGDECAGELAELEKRVGRVPVSFIMRGLRRQPEPPADLYEVLLADMGLWERFFGRVGHFRRWHYRICYAKRRKARR
jgi:hypothetical protein